MKNYHMKTIGIAIVFMLTTITAFSQESPRQQLRMWWAEQKSPSTTPHQK
jgi:hypothetical protein